MDSGASHRASRRFHNQMGMKKSIFIQLSRELQECGLVLGKHVNVDEQLSLFVYFAHTGSSFHMLQERFQRSAGTISG
jgi:hypothetical protein